jgi:hypothetical protein
VKNVKPAVKDVAFPEIPAEPELPVSQAVLVDPVFPAHPVSLVVLLQSVTSPPNPHAENARLVLLVTPAPPEMQETLAHLDSQVVLVTTDPQAHLDLKDLPEMLDSQAVMEPAVSPADLPFPHPLCPETPEPPVIKDLPVCPETLDKPVVTDNLDLPDPKDPLDLPAHQDSPAAPEMSDPKDPPVFKANAVSVPNTAPPTAVSSSKMEPEDRQSLRPTTNHDRTMMIKTRIQIKQSDSSYSYIISNKYTKSDLAVSFTHCPLLHSNIVDVSSSIRVDYFFNHLFHSVTDDYNYASIGVVSLFLVCLVAVATPPVSTVP